MIDPMDLHAFVDGELSPEQASSVRMSLEGSPHAAREVEAIRNLKGLLGQKTESISSQESWQSCVKRLDELDRAKEGAKAKRIESVVGRFAPVMCVALLACILAVGRYSSSGNKGIVTGQSFSETVGGFSQIHPPKSAENIERWEHNLIKESFRSTPENLTIRPVRRGVVNDLLVMEFSARDPIGDLKIFLIQGPLTLEGTQPMAGQPDLKVGTLKGMNCIVRGDGQSTTIIVADRSAEDLAKVAAQLKI